MLVSILHIDPFKLLNKNATPFPSPPLAGCGIGTGIIFFVFAPIPQPLCRRRNAKGREGRDAAAGVTHAAAQVRDTEQYVY